MTIMLDLKELEEFMLYKRVEEPIPLAVKTIQEPVKREKEKEKEREKEREKPSSYSDLFWCFYVMINGDFKYETLPNHNSVTQSNLRINYVSKVREKKNN